MNEPEPESGDQILYKLPNGGEGQGFVLGLKGGDYEVATKSGKIVFVEPYDVISVVGRRPGGRLSRKNRKSRKNRNRKNRSRKNRN